MKIHVLVEGPSERAFIEPWARRLLPECVVKVHPHQGKGALPRDLAARPAAEHRGLLHQLPAKLRAFEASLDASAEAVLVLVDADDENCVELRRRLLEVVEACAPTLRVAVRIAIEETEAFYLGDQRAIANAFPGADLELLRQHVPDSTPPGGTWELFAKVIDDGGGNKVRWGEKMSKAMSIDPARNRSPSFKALARALRALATPPTTAAKRARPYRHAARPRDDASRRR